MTSPKFYADLHCHPSLYSYNRMSRTELEHDPSRFHLWHPQPENTQHMRQAKRAQTYAQSDMAKMVSGRYKIVMASITPLEKGFLVPSQKTARNASTELIKLATGTTIARSGLAMLKKDRHAALNEALAILRNEGPIRQAVQQRILNYDPRRISFLMSDQYDYWEDFLHEYDYFCRKNGTLTTTHSPAVGSVTGRYTICDKLEQLEDITQDREDKELLVVMTIEGAHTFTMDVHDNRRPEDEIFERIDYLKDLDTPIFFLTLAHHFDNGICGHAHSMPDVVSVLSDQSHRMGEGFETENNLGRRVVQRLLALDDDLKDTGENRILIDCKHMSAQSRKEYYADIIEPANETLKKQRKPPIPVIFSHAAYSGVRSLDAMIRDQHKEDDHWKIGPYYAWTLHCSDEDILMILKTKGLFGVCFDQRVAGISNNQTIHPEQVHHILFQQILGAVDVAMANDDLSTKEKRAIWDCICLGTDFDGLIDPVDNYPTALDLDKFSEDLYNNLEEISHTRMIGKIGVQEIVEKIAWKNIYNFTEKHLPRAFKQDK